jgi:ribose 5-phosphate isomerase RpiB
LTEVGTDSTAPVDYPDYAEAVALGVVQGRSTLLHTIQVAKEKIS